MENNFNNTPKQQIDIKTQNGIQSFDADSVEIMYNYLVSYFHQSQNNGMAEIDSYDRNKLKKLLKLPDTMR